MRNVTQNKVLLPIVALFFIGSGCQRSEVLPENTGSSKSEPMAAIGDPDALKSGLVAYYPFNMDLLDHSGNNHDGTASGNIAYDLGHRGKKDSALVLGSGYVVTDQFFNFERTDSFSIAVWFKIKSNNTSGRLVSTECPEGNFRIGGGPGGVYAFQFGGFYVYDTVDTDTWNFVVYTYRNRKVKFYKNAQLKYKGTDTDTESLNYCSPFTIGAKASPDYDLWQGSIDDLRVYDRVLSAAEIKLLFRK